MAEGRSPPHHDIAVSKELDQIAQRQHGGLCGKGNLHEIWPWQHAALDITPGARRHCMGSVTWAPCPLTWTRLDYEKVGNAPMSKDLARLLPSRLLNEEVTGPGGEPTYLIETLPVEVGARVHVVFESAADNWRHGLFIATEGEFRTEDAISGALTLWADNSPGESPGEIVLEVLSTHGSLVFYNIWDRSKLGGFSSQSYTSAILREDLEDGWIRYRCQDFGRDADFTSLVVKVRVDPSR